ncbi:MAG TPA: DNA repair protein RecO, partial [Bacteroidia bacterium]|nr:DNA repair protein RecO [Bacteroidia bacterium]
LAKHLGFYPQQNKAGAKSVFDLRDGVFLPSIPAHPLYMDAAESRVLEQLLDLSYENMHTCDLSGEVRRVMLNNLLRYYELHLHSLHDVKSHQVLETVLS